MVTRQLHDPGPVFAWVAPICRPVPYGRPADRWGVTLEDTPPPPCQVYETEHELVANLASPTPSLDLPWTDEVRNRITPPKTKKGKSFFS